MRKRRAEREGDATENVRRQIKERVGNFQRLISGFGFTFIFIFDFFVLCIGN